MSANPTYGMNDTTAFQTPIAAATTYQLGEAPTRIGLTITNLGAGVVNMTSGGEASASFGYPLQSGQTISYQNPESCPKSFLSFFAIANATLCFVVTTERLNV